MLNKESLVTKCCFKNKKSSETCHHSPMILDALHTCRSQVGNKIQCPVRNWPVRCFFSIINSKLEINSYHSIKASRVCVFFFKLIFVSRAVSKWHIEQHLPNTHYGDNLSSLQPQPVKCIIHTRIVKVASLVSKLLYTRFFNHSTVFWPAMEGWMCVSSLVSKQTLQSVRRHHSKSFIL